MHWRTASSYNTPDTTSPAGCGDPGRIRHKHESNSALMFHTVVLYRVVDCCRLSLGHDVVHPIAVADDDGAAGCKGSVGPADDLHSLAQWPLLPRGGNRSEEFSVLKV